jgi:hypothetical protein
MRKKVQVEVKSIDYDVLRGDNAERIRFPRQIDFPSLCGA